VRANAAFRAVSVPAGEHEVRMDYRPASFTLGLAVTGLALLLCALASGTALRRSRAARADALVEPRDPRHPPVSRAQRSAGEGGAQR
jgi:hypothetical protein